MNSHIFSIFEVAATIVVSEDDSAFNHVSEINGGDLILFKDCDLFRLSFLKCKPNLDQTFFDVLQ